jgi:hypothetical protein
MAYAVHTRTCTYLLDEDGICRWIVSHRGLVPGHVRQCIGAQFVACLDLSEEGGLTGELRPGTRALFVRHFEDHLVLLRTGPIQSIDDRRDQLPAKPPPAIDPPEMLKEYGRHTGLAYLADPPRWSVVTDYGEERSVTVTLPTKRSPRR